MTPLDRDKIAAARLWASTRMPYLASAVFASTVQADPGSRTVGVDQSWTVRADPEVVDRLNVEQLGRLFVHLTGHLVRDHAGRAKRVGVEKDRARARWNRCADAELNDDLADDDCVPDVAPDLPSDLGAEPGGLAETYYAAEPRGPRRWDCGSGADGCAREGEEGHWLTRQQIELLRLGIASDIHRAAKLPGTVPGGWLRWAESVLPSRIDWRRVLAAETRRAVAAVAGKVDYSYRRPSRRAELHPDLVLATLVQPVPEIAIVCDTSGSMHDRLLGRALAEVEGVLKRTGLRSSQIRGTRRRHRRPGGTARESRESGRAGRRRRNRHGRRHRSCCGVASTPECRDRADRRLHPLAGEASARRSGHCRPARRGRAARRMVAAGLGAHGHD